MDPKQFDGSARFVGTMQSRRAAIAAVLGALELPHEPAPLAAKVLGQRKNTHSGQRPCYPGQDCLPGQGQDSSGCDFTGSPLFFPGAFPGADLSHSNVTGATMAGANLRGVDLGGACLVGANLRDAAIDGSTNLKDAIFCRPLMPDGSLNDRDCGKGTSCCPTPCRGESCTSNGACNEYGDFCGSVAGPCCPGWVCLNPLFSVCNMYCLNNEDCVAKVGANAVCAKNQPTLCGTDLPGDVGCCSCTGDVGCVLRPYGETVTVAPHLTVDEREGERRWKNSGLTL